MSSNRKSPRNHQFLKGKYSKEKVSNVPIVKPKRKVQQFSVQERRFQEEINEIRHRVMSSLKKSKCHYKSFGVRINLDFKQYLSRKYFLKNRYVNGHRFLADFLIKTSSKVNDKSSWVIQEDSFQFKIDRQRITKYKNDDDTWDEIKSSHFMTYKYIVTNKPTIEKAHLASMKSYITRNRTN